MGGVDPDLMGAAAEGRESYPGAGATPLEHLVSGLGGFAVGVDHLTRTVVQVGGEGQRDEAALSLYQPFYIGYVVLLHPLFKELALQP